MIVRNEDGTPVFITRKMYMHKEYDLEQYYRQFVTRRTLYQIRFTPEIWRDFLRAYAEHNLGLHLSVWDRFHLCTEQQRALRDRGDFPSIAGTVCVYKTAARMLVVPKFLHASPSEQNKFLYMLKAHDNFHRFKILLEEHAAEATRPQSQQYEHFRYLSETIPPSRAHEDIQKNVRQAG